MAIGERIRQARKRAGLTQKQLGEISGTSETTVKQYELGKRQPRIEQLQAIATALEVPVWELMDRENSIKFKKELVKNLPVQPDHPIPNGGVSDLDLAIYNALKSLTVRDKEMLAVMVEHMLASRPDTPPAPPEGNDTTPAAPPPESPQEGG